MIRTSRLSASFLVALTFVGCVKRSPSTGTAPNQMAVITPLVAPESFRERRLYQREIVCPNGSSELTLELTQTKDNRLIIATTTQRANGTVRTIHASIEDADLRDVEFQDLDHDGAEEAIIRYERSPADVMATILRLGKPDSTSSCEPRIIFQGGGRRGVRILDFDGDGRFEVVACTAGSMFEEMDCEVYGLNSHGDFVRYCTFSTVRDPSSWKASSFPSVTAQVISSRKKLLR